MSERRWYALPKGSKKVGPLKLGDLSSIEASDGLKLRRDDEQEWWPLESALDRFPELKEIFGIESAMEKNEQKRLAERKVFAAQGPQFDLPEITRSQLMEAFESDAEGPSQGPGGKLLDDSTDVWNRGDATTAREMMLATLEVGLDSTSDQANAHQHIAVAYAMENRLQYAVEHFLKTLSIYGLGKEDAWEAASRLTYIYREVGLYTEASLVNYYAFILQKRGGWYHLDELREFYQALARSIFNSEDAEHGTNSANGELIEVQHQLGVQAFQQGDLNQAISHFTAALDLKPDDISTAALSQNLAGVHCTKGDFQTGIEWFERSLSLDPNNSETLANLGLALVKTGDDEKALHILSQSLGANAYNIAARVTTGQVLKRLGKLDEAKMQFESVIGSGMADERALTVVMKELAELSESADQIPDSDSTSTAKAINEASESANIQKEPPASLPTPVWRTALDMANGDIETPTSDQFIDMLKTEQYLESFVQFLDSPGSAEEKDVLLRKLSNAPTRFRQALTDQLEALWDKKSNGIRSIIQAALVWIVCGLALVYLLPLTGNWTYLMLLLALWMSYRSYRIHARIGFRETLLPRLASTSPEVCNGQ